MKKIPKGKKCLALNKDSEPVWCPYYEDLLETDPLYGVCSWKNSIIIGYNKVCYSGLRNTQIQWSNDEISDILSGRSYSEEDTVQGELERS